MKPLELTRARVIQLATILCLGAVFASGCVVHSHDRRHGHAVYRGPAQVHSSAGIAVAPAPVTFVFTDHHRHTVGNYYHNHPPKHWKKHKKKKDRGHGRGHGRGHEREGLPPGLAKRDVLPPGLQMQSLPPGLASQLPPPPQGTQFIYHDDQVLWIDLQTRVVLDFINISVGF
ncbi:MAG: hypothetical protein OEZ51_11815 [Nitrospinota bacterium]|nr:hypothetical protein [Nitrospinota bacterium]